ncbi:hypothetical protein C5167_028264 [Papaver somniferum]|nr:hypothetical protein C5167_028264 [Papaver somniferum]
MIQENVGTSKTLQYMQQQRQVQGTSQRGRGTRGGRGIRGRRGTRGGRGTHMNDPCGAYTPHLGSSYLSLPHEQYMNSPDVPHMSRTIPYGNTFVPYTDHPAVPYGTPMPIMVTTQEFGSAPTNTNHVSFSELLESNPWDLV